MRGKSSSSPTQTVGWEAAKVVNIMCRVEEEALFHMGAYKGAGFRGHLQPLVGLSIFPRLGTGISEHLEDLGVRKVQQN